MPVATEKQIGFLKVLVAERPGKATEMFGPENIESALETATTLSVGMVSNWITMLKNSPREIWRDAPVDPDGVTLVIPTGRYADPVTGNLFKIQTVTSGKWTGWMFVKTGSDYSARVKLGQQRINGQYKGKSVDELKRIADDPQDAAAYYGQLTGQCGRCNRTLEDPVSVERGIGPVCFKGWQG